MNKQKQKTLRLIFPQWQGGNRPEYPLGARLLAWLAPSTGDLQLEVPVEPFEHVLTELEDGIVGREAIIKQLRAARSLMDAHNPDRLVIFGGDCLVDLAPFAYLNERHDGKLGVLWIDAHPDIATPAQFAHAHTMVLGSLLGHGDAALAAEVPVKLAPERVMFAGLQETFVQETDLISTLGMRRASCEQLALSSQLVLDWIEENRIEHLAIHFDLDVLDPHLFRALLFSNPEDPDLGANYPVGKMKMQHVTRLIKDVSAKTNVVGLGITEHLPWEALNLQAMLQEFPILRD